MTREIATRTRRDLASWQKAALGLLALSVGANTLLYGAILSRDKKIDNLETRYEAVKAIQQAADELGCKDVRTARKDLEEMDVPPVQVGKSKKYEIETLARAIVCARGMC